MKNVAIFGGVLLILILSSINLTADAGLKLAPGEVEVLYDFQDPVPGVELASPEGIAFDRTGNMFISLRTKSASGFIANEIIKISPTGMVSDLAQFGNAEGAFGAIGLTTDPQGNVYVAFNTETDDHGVWKVYPDGQKEHLAGSDQIGIPNSLVFDGQGNLYATDSSAWSASDPAVWRYSKKEQVFMPWAGDPLLTINVEAPVLVGANGIAFVPPNHLYVANTSYDLIAHISIQNDGSAGDISLVAAGPPMINPDGLAVDAHGNVYTVVTISTFPVWFVVNALGLEQLPVTPVVRIIPETGEIQPVLDIVDLASLTPGLDTNPYREYFDMPTSLAFGTGPRDHKSVYVVGIGMVNFGLPPGTGPKLTQVGVGIPGSK